MLIEASLTGRILKAFFSSYRSIGFGYPESIYRNALAVELQTLGIGCSREVPIEVVHRGVVVGTFRLDFVVEKRVLVEVKAAITLIEAHRHQIQSYLKASPFEVGLLLNFGPTPEHERFIYTIDRK